MGVESLSAVIAEHRPFVRNALARLGVDVAALDDAEQEVFEVLVRRRADYDPAYSVRGWLWGISRNVAAAQRRRSRRGAWPLHEHALAEGPRAEDRVAVMQALAHLDDDHRAVWLARQRGCTASEIADDRRVPLTTVQWRLREAQRRLQLAVGRVGRRCRAVVFGFSRGLSGLVGHGGMALAAGTALAAMLVVQTPASVDATDVASRANVVVPGPSRSVAIVRADIEPVPVSPPRVDPGPRGEVVTEDPTLHLAATASEPSQSLASKTAVPSQPPRPRARPRRPKPRTPQGDVQLLEPVVAPAGPLHPAGPSAAPPTMPRFATRSSTAVGALGSGRTAGTAP